MPSRFIYHMCPKSNWATAVDNGVYHGGDLDRRDGFIHFSSAEQVRETAARYLAGVRGLVLIQIDSRRLGDALEWENSRDNLLFPHLYAPLNPADIDAVFELPLDENGQHVFPDLG